MSGRYLIVGAGAIGALLAAQWTLAGIPAVLIARGRQLEAIRRNGVRVRRPQGDETVPVTVASAIDEASPARADTVVLAVKSQDAETAVAAIAWRPLVDGGVIADLPILTLQNGLAAEDVALRRFARVTGVSIGIAASHLEPGVVVSPSWPVIGVAWLGGHPAASAQSDERHRAAFERAGYAAFVEPDIAAAKRRKLLGNLRNVVEVFRASEEELVRATDDLRDEARGLFERLGLPVAADPDPGAIRLRIEPIDGHEPGHLSTWQSLARGASVESDYLSGEIVLLARRAGLAAPRNAAIQRALGVLAGSGGAPGTAPLPPELARSAAVAGA
ncbi:ketopantoate reductase family protein [Microbacterium sp. 18062]|uniref:ketopantoate reductase family protein n=1 Tax=Microbacterium sp. 18062 TaxID=2681410 RepID=UPI00135A3C03|nr:2-dehydropantoate 2-reductase N-terminal domain-containing protein [Microbacterium sp. 18062]